MASKRKPTDGTPPLFAEPSQPTGRMQQAVLDVLDDAKGQGLLDDLDAALAQLAVEAARAVDFANGSGDPYAFSQPARELRETLARLKLDPTAREGGSGRDPFAELLDDLADNDGTATPVRDSSQP